MRSLLFFGLTAVTVYLAVWSLVSTPAGHVQAQPAEHAADYDPVQTRLNDEGELGPRVYLQYCSGCHGVNGDGKGPAAPFLSPRPRDFTSGTYKFTSTPAGSPPLEEDLLLTLERGLKGTSMPSWHFVPINERHAVVKYILGFHKEWEFRTKSPAVPFHENPVDLEDQASIEKALAAGKTIYHKQTTCWSCHPSYLNQSELQALTGGNGREDLARAIAKPDQWGESILPPDFTRDTLKSIRSLKDLYRAITAGVGGTAMPTWKGVLTPEQLWSLVLYVDSLRPEPYSTTKQILKKIKEAK